MVLKSVKENCLSAWPGLWTLKKQNCIPFQASPLCHHAADEVIQQAVVIRQWADEEGNLFGPDAPTEVAKIPDEGDIKAQGTIQYS